MSVENGSVQPPPESPQYIRDIQQQLPSDWEDPRVKVVRLLVEQSGVLSGMVEKNLELQQRIADFFVGNRGILVVGGESGMGKSLISADLRHMHRDLGLVLPEAQHKGLAVISWDRTHQAFFEEVSTAAGETIPLPKGETHLTARKIVSGVLADQITFLRKYVGEDIRIILEAPLIDTRGETVFAELARFQSEIQTFIMHSPESRLMTLQEGRLMETSGQPDSMGEIREKLLFRIMGNVRRPFSQEEQDEIIKRWWLEKMTQWNGLVVEWNPNDNRERYDNSVEIYKAAGIKPDHLSPRSLNYATRNQFESIFRAIQDIDRFLQTISS